VHEHDVTRADERPKLRRVRPRNSLVVLALRLAELAAVPRAPVEAVVDALRDREDSGSPWITSQRTSSPAPRPYARRVWSISATPPPVAVEFTLTTARPAKRSCVASAIAS